jgi:hypothetical protein
MKKLVMMAIVLLSAIQANASDETQTPENELDETQSFVFEPGNFNDIQLMVSTGQCSVAPQNDCSASQKRLCCYCDGGSLSCY